AKLREAVRDYLPHRRVALVAGMSGDKDVGGIVAELMQMRPAFVVTGRSRHPRSVQPVPLAETFQRAGCADVTPGGTVADALAKAVERSLPGDLVVVTGSLFAAAEAREAVYGIAPEVYPEFLPGQPTVP